jgi:chemotaxis-related protein WspD
VGDALTDTYAAATRLLDRDVSDESLRESTANVAAKKNVVEPGAKSVLIFRIGTEWLGLPTNVVLAVGDQRTVRRLPGRRSGILSGLVSVRGELLLTVALGVVLGLDKPPEEEKGRPGSSERLVICKRLDARLAFQVSEVHGVHRYHPVDLRKAPATLSKAAAGIYTLGVVPWKDRMVGCLDDELLFYTLSKGLA